MPSKAMRVTAGMFKRPLKRDEMLLEFRAIRRDPAKAARSAAAKTVLRACTRAAEGIPDIPHTSYTLSREYGRIGVRRNYDQAFSQKRSKFTMAALLAIFRRERRWIDLVQDYIWDICEETSWVVPEHMGSYPIDLFAAETAFMLAEATHLMGDVLDPEIIDRARTEVGRRILEPYLDKDWTAGWFDGRNNWSGVCHGAVAAAFLYLEKSPARLARAINRALAGLEIFRTRAFLEDGGSSEGASYWQYGLINVVDFSELLRRRTRGKIDFLSHEKFARIAEYPLAVAVAPGKTYSCSDCRVDVRFSPGFIARLAERTGARGMTSFLNRAAVASNLSRLPWALRDILWWDGRMRRPRPADDRMLPETGVARMVAPRQHLVVMAKAGNNRENHNHNDVGSFAVYVDSEPLLCDAGTGLYDGAYFGPRRYENPVCGSYGHSVPRIAGREQQFGAKYRGRITAFKATDAAKRLDLEFARAYGLKGIRKLERRIALDARGPEPGRIYLRDTFTFSGRALPVEEAFVTWGRVSVRGRTARIRGEKHDLLLKVVEPAGAVLTVEDVPVMMSGAAEPRTLRRIACVLPKGATSFKLAVRPRAK